MWRGMHLISSVTLIFLVANAARAEYDDPWPDLQEAIFPGKSIASGEAFMRLEAPARAHDAAVVPVHVSIDAGRLNGAAVRALTLIVDKNPAPVAAVFQFAGKAVDPSIGIRIRINEYTNIHAVAETTDGRLYAVATFIKAAGGCSAPASKAADEAIANAGQMKFKQLQRSPDSATQVEMMIRHPNHTGLQMDPITRHYTPAHFIETVAVRMNGEMVLKIEGSISLSENPAFHFWLRPEDTGMMEIEAQDTKGRRYDGRWILPAS